MGTFCEIQTYHPDSDAADRAMTAALDEMQRVDRLLSNYDPASELSRMNREAAAAPFRASDELFDFIRRCHEYFEDTAGAFDPTVGPLVRAWGFFTPAPSRPTDAARAAARARSGFDKVRLEPADRTIRFLARGLEIDPGGVGKGYAVDRAVQVLRRLGVESALVSAGGSTLYAIGHPPARASWTVAIRNPADPDRPFAFVPLRDDSLSTSGVSEQSVEAGGHRYSHIFDPRTGEPVEHMCQATVVAPTATDSDALTKAAFVLSRAGVARVAAGRRGVHVLRVEGGCDRPDAVWTTPGSASVFPRHAPLNR